MVYNITFDEFTSDLFNEYCCGSPPSTIHFAEEPGLLDTRLFLILSALCQTPDGRKILQTSFSLSEKSISIFSRINRSNVRNFIGIVSVSFQPAIDHSDLIEHLQNFNYNENFNTVNPQKPSREEFLFHRFCMQFWLGAIRQISCNEVIARLVFGLSEELAQALMKKSTEDILDFAQFGKQRFSLRLSERFFESIPSISDAASNPNVSLVKIAYAVQSLACFDSDPRLLSSTSSFSFADVISRVAADDSNTSKLPGKVLMGIRNLKGTFNRYQNNKDKIASENNGVFANVKQAFGVFMMQKGLTKSQVSYIFGYETWKARQDSREILMTVDSRKRSKQRITSEYSVQRMIFYCLYVTFAGKLGLEHLDLQAFFRACDFLNLPTLRSRLKTQRVTNADRFDDVKLLTQGLIYLQRCPTCNFVNFYEKKAGEFLETEDTVMPCCFCENLAKDDTLKLFSRFVKNSLEMTPEDPESYFYKHSMH